jgi:hypothetical protein
MMFPSLTADYTGPDPALTRAQRSLATTAANTASWQLTQAQEAWDLKKKSAEQAGTLAATFMEKWGSAMEGVQGMYSTAMDTLKSLTSGVQASTSGTLSKLGDISDLIGQEYQDFKTTYGGAEEEFLTGAREEALARRQMAGQLGDLAKPDYEGAAGRAATDVRTQSAIARESMTKDALGMGVDPSSGKFGALSRRTYVQEAADTANAMNAARRGEKERVSNLTLQGLSVLDPNKTGGMAINIRGQGTEMLGQQAGVAGKIADVETARTQAITNIADTTGRLASGYSQAVTQPYGEMAGYFLGKSGAA